jgi:hypothetical protein
MATTVEDALRADRALTSDRGWPKQEVAIDVVR